MKQSDKSAKPALHGDFRKTTPSEVFQLLVGSQRRGTLIARGLLGEVRLFVADGQVRSLVAERRSGKHIGRWLVARGLVTDAQIEQALEMQTVSRRPLGRILAEIADLSDDQIDAVGRDQAAEDLYDVFNWDQGRFEFHADDDGVPNEVDVLAAFECNGVMLEVARRRDEWARIRDSYGSVDEVLVPKPDGTVDPDLAAAPAAVLAALDGKVAVRDLPDHVGIGMFDCAVIVRELFEADAVVRAWPQQVFAAASVWIERKDQGRAVLMLEALLARDEPLADEHLTACVELLCSLRQNELAGQTLLRAARRQEDRTAALRLAREAAGIDRRSTEVAEFLYQRERRDAGGVTLIRAACGYASRLVADGRTTEAHGLLHGLLEDQALEIDALRSGARQLFEIGMREQAVQWLEEVMRRVVSTPSVERPAIEKACRELLRVAPGHRGAVRELAVAAGRAKRARWTPARIGALGAAAAALAIVAWIGFGGGGGEADEDPVSGAVATSSAARPAAPSVPEVEPPPVVELALADAVGALADGDQARMLSTYHRFLVELGAVGGDDEGPSTLAECTTDLVERVVAFEAEVLPWTKLEPNSDLSDQDAGMIVRDVNRLLARPLCLLTVDPGARRAVEVDAGLNAAVARVEVALAAITMLRDGLIEYRELRPLYESGKHHEGALDFARALVIYEGIASRYLGTDRFAAEVAERIAACRSRVEAARPGR